MKIKGVVSASYCTDEGDTKIHVIPENPAILREIDGDYLAGFGGQQIMAVLGKVPRPETCTAVELEWDLGIGALIFTPKEQDEPKAFEPKTEEAKPRSRPRGV